MLPRTKNLNQFASCKERDETLGIFRETANVLNGRDEKRESFLRIEFIGETKVILEGIILDNILETKILNRQIS